MEAFHKLHLFLKRHVFRHLTRRFFVIIFFGQILSILLCSAGTASQKLVTACGVKIPAFQGFLNYCLLTIVFTSKLAYNSQEFLKVLKERWWKYILIGCIDVEANYMVYKAYAYTSLTSVQLLDCFSIPVVVFLSIVALKSRYKPVHFLGILVCVSGMGFLVWADIHGSRDQGPKPGDTSAEVLGDVLVICGAALYGASNVAEEFVVKTASMTEFLGMMSLFACFFSGANVIIFETKHLAQASWDHQFVLLLALNAFAMFGFYVLMPILISRSSATLINLTLLTADLYSFFIGLYLFNYKFSHLYIISFVVIVIGVIIFKVFPTPSRVDVDEASGSAINEEEQQPLCESTE